nr:metallophosphoesterase family protein [Rhizobium sp. L1K21]
MAVIADIHGNHLALEAVLDDIAKQGVDVTLNLGDCFSGPLEAGKVADMLIPLNLSTVRGNHDRALIDRPREAMSDWEVPSIAQLSEAHLEWIRTLPFEMRMNGVYCCHATPQDDNTYWTETVSPSGSFQLNPLRDIERIAEGISEPLILCGHTHIARAVHLSDGRMIVNPGSVGCPGYDYDVPRYHKVEVGHPFASYAIVEAMARGWQAQFRQVRYDHHEAARIARERSFHDWAAVLGGGWLPED